MLSAFLNRLLERLRATPRKRRQPTRQPRRRRALALETFEDRVVPAVQAVSLAGHETRIRAYPISIEWPPSALQTVPAREKCRADVFAEFELAAGTKVIVGVERFDYTKGILDRMRAVDALLARNPAWKAALPAFTPETMC